LNEVAISLAAFKQAGVGDEIVLLTEDGQVGWFVVDVSDPKRGCKGGTTITLRDLASGDVHTHTIRATLPAGVVRVRRVSAGVNARTMRKSLVAAPKAKDLVVQPSGEFENILDVPLLDEEISTTPTTEVAEVVEAVAPECPVETVETLEIVSELTEESATALTETPEPLTTVDNPENLETAIAS
jgi:hypothetical protein